MLTVASGSGASDHSWIETSLTTGKPVLKWPSRTESWIWFCVACFQTGSVLRLSGCVHQERPAGRSQCFTFCSPQLDGSVFCSQPSVAQEQLHFWILGSVRLHPPADLHPAAVPGQIRESGPRLQMKPDQKQTAQSLGGLDQNCTSLSGQRKRTSDCCHTCVLHFDWTL